MRLLTDALGAVRARYDLGAPAEQTTESTIKNDPQAGRFLSPDPLGLAGGSNPYAYPAGTNQIAIGAALGFAVGVGAYWLGHRGRFDGWEAARWGAIGALAGGTLGLGLVAAGEAGFIGVGAAEAEAGTSGLVQYGSTDLSGMAIRARQVSGVYGGRNAAVFEVRMDGALRTFSGFSERYVGHAERLVWRALSSQGVLTQQVTRIYSQIEPYTYNGCKAWIGNTFPNAGVTWSFAYGGDPASRSAGIAALEEAVSRLR